MTNHSRGAVKSPFAVEPGWNAGSWSPTSTGSNLLQFHFFFLPGRITLLVSGVSFTHRLKFRFYSRMYSRAKAYFLLRDTKRDVRDK